MMGVECWMLDERFNFKGNKKTLSKFDKVISI
jgi:hypothetical protein